MVETKDRGITITETADDLNISFGSCQSILMDVLGIARMYDPNLLKLVITGDESWIFGYDIETKAQSSRWKRPGEPRPKKVRQVCSNVKILLTVFFDYYGVGHQDFLPQGRTVNKKYYHEAMWRLRESIRKKRPEMWKANSWILHHDNVPAHK